MLQTRFGSDDERYRYARPTDLPAIADMLGDPEVGRWLWFAPAPRDAYFGFFRPLLDRQWELLADGRAPTTAVFVAEHIDGTFLGQGSALAVEGSAGGFEIGYCLPRAAWRKGVGTRLAQFLVAWSIYAHDAFRIQAGCIAGNVGSRALLEKLGLKLEGVRPEYRLKEEQRHDECEYGARVDDLDDAMLRRAFERAAFDE